MATSRNTLSQFLTQDSSSVSRRSWDCLVVEGDDSRERIADRNEDVSDESALIKSQMWIMAAQSSDDCEHADSREKRLLVWRSGHTQKSPINSESSEVVLIRRNRDKNQTFVFRKSLTNDLYWDCGIQYFA